MTTLTLPFKRFVAQVSTGAPRIKSTYIALMEENLTALKACPWREADADVPVTLTPHDFMQASYFDDAFDAFKMTGAYNTSDMTEIGFAGMAAYRFKVPDDALVPGSEIALSSLALPVSRDRFLRTGVHVGVELTDRATPSTDWATIRGTGDLAKTALSQETVEYLVAGDVGSESVTVDLSGVSANPKAYIWVYLTLEDYTDSWSMYDRREQRLYAIEGSAMLVGGSASATFAADVTPDDAGEVALLSGGSSPTWLQPLPTVTVGNAAPSVPAGDALVETFFTSQQSARTALPFSISTSLYTPTMNPNTSFVISGTGRRIQQVKWAGIELSITPGASVSFSQSVPWGSGTASVGGTVEAIADTDSTARLKWTASVVRSSDGSTGSSRNTSGVAYDSYRWSYWYLMLKLTNGEPSDADVCDDVSESSRRGETLDISGSSSPWTVTIGGTAYTVKKSGSTVTMAKGTATLGTWTSAYSASEQTFFDASVRLYLPGTTANGSVANYGLAAVAGDFSHAVATFEQGTQPTNAELLGRLARMSRETSGAMAYLHPAAGAIADELDVLRPVPRFFRVQSGSEPAQTTCQPGLSAWYYRPSTGSDVSQGLAYRDAVASIVATARPVFLQLALLALRAPRAFENRIVLANGSGSAIGNGFALRFVAWRSPAGLWDRSTSFALSAMASMPSIYRSDGDGSLSWQVDCSGALAPFGSRTVSATRIGASEVVSGNIADGAEIGIVLSEAVAEGDVVLIAPEIVGFADGTGGASVTFGRQANPATATSFGAWARYTADLGWFPTVTGS